MALVNILINTIAVFVAGYILPGIKVEGLGVALVAAIVLGILNSVVRPILLFLTLPLNILTLGLFTFVINAGMVLLASNIVLGFSVASFWWALLFSLVLSILNVYLHWGLVS
ncbi:MAG: phage holin family protein [Patescibacteria group bacterium]